MVSYRATSVSEPAAQMLLDEYFHDRTETFPESMGTYRIAFPGREDFEPPQGIFLIVEDEDLAGESADVGCGGIRRLATAAAEPVRYEVKHLYLRPFLRGRGFGGALLAQLEARALELGAGELVLDTNASLAAAAGLYRSSGYAETEAYNDNPNATHWYRKSLD